MIKYLKSNRINVDRRGKITTGMKVTNDKGVEYPKATDFFVIDDFPELKAIYGDKPKKLVIVFPTDDVTDFFTADLVLYGSNNQMIRKCDGEECLHRIDESLNLINRYNNAGDVEELEKPIVKNYVAGEISECCCKLMPQEIEKDGKLKKNPKLCNVAMYMKAFIVNYKTGKIVSPLCYHFYSGSENTASNIYSELKKTSLLRSGAIKGIPFGLSVDMVSGRTDAKKKYPIWNLQVLGTMAQLEQSAESFLFDYRAMLQGGTANRIQLYTGDEKEDKKINIDAEKEIEEIKRRQEPQYWIDEIEKIKTYSEYESFKDEYYLELTMFGGSDAERITDAMLNKKNKLLNKKSE